MKEACSRQPFVQEKKIRLGALGLLLSVIQCVLPKRKEKVLATLKTGGSFH
jgi:hypothetical protein